MTTNTNAIAAPVSVGGAVFKVVQALIGIYPPFLGLMIIFSLFGVPWAQSVLHYNAVAFMAFIRLIS